MSKGYSTSGASVLVQLAAWRSDDSFRPVDPRVDIAATALILVELLRLGKLAGKLEADGIFTLEVIDNSPVGDFIIDGMLFWTEVGGKSSAIDMLIEQAPTVIDRIHTSLIAQNVLLDSPNGLVIPANQQDALRAVLRDTLFDPEATTYPHEALFHVLAATYNPNAALFFSLVGLPFDRLIMEDLFARVSPWEKMDDEIKVSASLLMASLYEATKIS